MSLALLLAGCSGGIVDGSGPTGSTTTPGTGGTGGTSRPPLPGTGGTGMPGPGPGMQGPGGNTTVPIPTSPSLLPTRVRRLSNFEYDRTIQTLFGTQGTASAFAVDFRQSDYTQNAAQAVDATYAAQLQGAARTIAAAQVSKAIGTAGCSAAQGESCAQQVITRFGEQVFRRPVTANETTRLMTVFRAGANGGTFESGIELVLTTMLQSPSFLYVTELGEGAPQNGTIKLGEWEIASALSYLITGGPPDPELRMAAAARKLSTAAERDRQARRLMMQPGARLQVRRMIKEWLGVDRIESTGKDNKVYPKFDDLRPKMAAEADAFVEEVFFGDDATLTKLLTADYTVVDSQLAQFYGISSTGRTTRSMLGTVPRKGILMQAAFLSVHAHDHESAPIKRGAVIMKKVLCSPLPEPGELNLQIVPPPPDPNKTTRERFAIHSTDPACGVCHVKLDPFGFALENLDGMGALRTTENGKPVNTAATLDAPGVTGPVKDGTEMVQKLAASELAQQCFARQIFRFGAAQTGEGYEALFLNDVWNKLPADKKVNLKEIIVALAASDLFVTRRQP